jgi:fumarate reductase subunit C
MAEMRHPRDFWKSALCAQLFCFLMYMLFGLVCYSKQGQYSSILPTIDYANQTLILVNNIIALTTTMVAAVLYGNIGVKVFYENVLRAYFKAPSIITIRGRWIWTFTVCAYWGLAWGIGSAIPNITALITLVGAACILQFTYTFPPVLLLGFWMQCDAIKGDNPWTPGMEPGSNRIDTWKDTSRWIRGFRKYWYVKTVLVRFSLLLTHGHGTSILYRCVVPHVPRRLGQLRARYLCRG